MNPMPATTTPATAPEPENNVATALIQKHNKGRAARELNESMSDLILAVRKHGKPGKVVLEINLKPGMGSDASRVETTLTVNVKAPVGAPVARLYFTTADGALSDRDPEQEEFPAIRALDKDTPAEPLAPVASTAS